MVTKSDKVPILIVIKIKEAFQILCESQFLEVALLTLGFWMHMAKLPHQQSTTHHHSFVPLPI